MFFLDTKFERPDLLVVPIAPLPDQHEPQLDRLLGANRAAVLALLAQGPLCTTDIATRAGLSPAAASDHARVLREAGLLTTDRSRRATHTITPTGAALLGRP
nr:winged helix-turn-helix domain-containing protein [Kribbella sandramycini]